MRTTSLKALFNLRANDRKLGLIVNRGCTVVLAALVFGWFLPGCTAAALNQPAGGAADARADNPGHVKLSWLRIMAFTDAPLVGADIRVYYHHSELRPSIEVPAATNNRGVFAVEVPSSLFQSRSIIRVTLSAGTTNGDPFVGHLSTDVALVDPEHQLVVINPVTTLVSALRDALPDPKLESALVRVRRFLGLPDGYGLGLALRESSGYRSPFFSPTVFLAEANTVGGLDNFEARLVRELLASASTVHPFRSPQAPGGAAKFIAKNLAAGVLRWGAGAGVGWIMQSTGIMQPDATEADIDALQQSLADLQSSVDALSSQVAQLTQLVQSTATQTQYNTIVTAAQPLAITVTTVESDLSFFAQWCPPLPGGGTTLTASDAFCTNQAPILKQELTNSYQNKDYEHLEGYIQDNGTLGVSGMLHLYSLWLGQSKQFFRPADSTKMQNLYDYWDAALTSAANLRMELFHELGDQDTPAGQAQMIAFMGDPTQTPPTTGVFQANQDTNLNLMFPPVPADTVVSTGDHTMWALLPWVQNSGEGRTWPEAYCFYRFWPFADNQVTQGYAGFDNWLGSPTMAMWQAAVSRAPALSTGINWGTWLNNQTLANAPDSPTSPGFNYSCEDDTWHEWFWTSTPSSSGYKVISLITNVFITSGQATDYNVSYPVRNLKSGEQYFWYQ